MSFKKEKSSSSTNSSFQINQTTIDTVLKGVLDNLQKSTTVDKPLTNTDLFSQYVSAFLKSDKRKTMNSEFAKQIQNLPKQPLIDAIEISTGLKHSIIGPIVKLWHCYIKENYAEQSKHALKKADLMEKLGLEVFYAKQYFTELIDNLYRDWIGLLSPDKSIDDDIEVLLIPNMLTQGDNWKEVYYSIAKKYSKLTLNFKREDFCIDPSFFEMSSAFNCKQLAKPFDKTANIIRRFCSEPNMAVKLDILMQIPETIKNQIFEHQQSLIKKGELKQPKLIEVDNLISCMEYSILLANMDIEFHLTMLESFYNEDYLGNLGIFYLYTSLKVAARVLSDRDQSCQIPPSSHSKSPPRTSSSGSLLQKSLIMRNYDGIKIQSSSIRFNRLSPFSHCFQYSSLKSVRMLQTSWTSIFSERPLKKQTTFTVRLNGSNLVMLGIYAPEEGKQEQLRDYSASKRALCLCMHSGLMWRYGDRASRVDMPGKKPTMLEIALKNSVVSWGLKEGDGTGRVLAQEDIGELANGDVYFHAVMGVDAELEII